MRELHYWNHWDITLEITNHKSNINSGEQLMQLIIQLKPSHKQIHFDPLSCASPLTHCLKELFAENICSDYMMGAEEKTGAQIAAMQITFQHDSFHHLEFFILSKLYMHELLFSICFTSFFLIEIHSRQHYRIDQNTTLDRWLESIQNQNQQTFLDCWDI